MRHWVKAAGARGGACLVDAQAGDVQGPLRAALARPEVAPMRLHRHAQPCLGRYTHAQPCKVMVWCKETHRTMKAVELFQAAVPAASEATISRYPSSAIKDFTASKANLVAWTQLRRSNLGAPAQRGSKHPR